MVKKLGFLLIPAFTRLREILMFEMYYIQREGKVKENVKESDVIELK